MKEKKILMVCLGNICRSPLAEGILADKCKHLPIVVDSAGTSAYHVGQAPDQRSQHIASVNNINIGEQRARKLMSSDLESFDLIYAMDSSNYTNILKLAKNEKHKHKVRLILNESNPEQNQNVPDPYFGGDQGFKHVFDLLNSACEAIKTQLENEFNV